MAVKNEPPEVKGPQALEAKTPIVFPSGRYDIIYVDPPWRYRRSGSQSFTDYMGSADNHYPTMTEDEIGDLPIRSIMSKTSVVFMWATSPMLDLAIRTIARWGLSYRGMPYIWIKTKKDGSLMGAIGVTPTFVKPKAEFVLAATVKNMGRPFPIVTMKSEQLVFAPRGRHSEKPEEVRRRIEQLCGHRPRIELFARRPAPGWTVWGNEVGND